MEAIGDPVAPGEVDRPLGGDPDGPLLGLGLWRIGRVVEAVEQPGVDVEAHVDDVDRDRAGIGDRIHHALEEHEARVLTAPDADQRHPGRDPGRAEPVEPGRHQPGNVRPVPVVVDVPGVDAGQDLAGPVDQRDVGGEVAAEPAVEVGPQVGEVAVDAGVDDAHQHPAAPLVDPVGAARGGVDHPHVPLLVGERLLARDAPALLAAERLTAARSAAVRRSTSSFSAGPPPGILPTGRLRAAPTRADWPPAALMAARAAAAEAPSA
jgi:hypothetical protein